MCIDPIFCRKIPTILMDVGLCRYPINDVTYIHSYMDMQILDSQNVDEIMKI
jgi:hypothetical protein